MTGQQHAGDRAEPVGPLTFDRVLLPLDGSTLSAAALPTARALADRFRAQLVVFTVATDERDGARRREAVTTSIADDQPVPEVEVVLADDAAQEIATRASEQPSSVVCLSTRSHGRLAGALIGSVARGVLRQSRRPVVAVGPQADRPVALVGRPRRRPASWPEPLSVERLVACVDGSAVSEAVLPEAARWARALEMRLTILTVAEESASITGTLGSNRHGPPDPVGYVRELADRWSGVVPDTVGEVAWDPVGVASGVRAHLAARPAGLVAMTTRARTGIERARLGATAAEIVGASTVPSLVVPLPG